MKYSEQFEQLLKQALSPDTMPDEKLNNQIREWSKEKIAMKKISKKKAAFIPIVATFALFMSIGVFAAWNLLNPEKVAKEAEDDALSKAFEGEDAIILDETRIDGGYKITLLGLVSGKGISDFAGQEMVKDRTYAVVAIANQDGSPMPDTFEEEYGKVPFFISPLVKGIEPWQFNIYHMDGGYVEIVREGIQYRIIDCDSIEMFADRGVELCVIGNAISYDKEAFTYDEQSGEVTPNEDYAEVNVVFELPIDKDKADPEAAEQYLEDAFTRVEKNQKILEEKQHEVEEEASLNKLEELLNNPELFNQMIAQGTEVPGSLKECKVDEKGYIHYEFYSDEYGGCNGEFPVAELFPDENTNVNNNSVSISSDGDGNEMITVIQFKKEESGVITARIIVL